ncbi:Copalyl diphosphate synthase [Quillaja saponaria]|uniref:Copalyl diphosphate synthase n=1 Tax=Quillaja saponaria TaxID=32244 RepID=A0AAD7QAI5_QUISA|nr:Copalyl diphosphate synthase [Quillaja saponaria]
MLESMGDGEVSISAYDTAWVALVKDLNGTHSPQFPSSLEWIANNQLHDGSWGDSQIFQAHDRIINNLACVIALKTWKIHPKKCEKGMEFLQANIRRLEDENAEHMPIGFEIAFPSLLEMAKSLDIQIHHEDSVINLQNLIHEFRTH